MNVQPLAHPHPGKESIPGTPFVQVTEPLCSLMRMVFPFNYTYSVAVNRCFSVVCINNFSSR